jgi:hypothetical protein
VSDPDGPSKQADVTGFRVLLVLWAVVTFGVGLWGLFAAGWLHAVLGLEVAPSEPGFVGLARIYGAAMIAFGVGYAIAAAHPLRQRGLLVVLFVAPLAAAVALIIAAAKGEIARFRGGAIAAADLAFVLLYFRLYPKPVTEALPQEAEDAEAVLREEDQPPSA